MYVLPHYAYKNPSKQTIMISTQRTQYLFVSLFRLFLNLTDIYKRTTGKKNVCTAASSNTKKVIVSLTNLQILHRSTVYAHSLQI